MKRAEGRYEHWAGLSRAWERSGQTQGDFCAARGIELGTFRWWRWRLGGGRESSSPELATMGSGSSWVEVSRASSVERQEVGGRSSSELRLVFCDGLEIHIPADFDTETLRRVLSVLGELAC